MPSAADRFVSYEDLPPELLPGEFREDSARALK
jgi:hypothetical protein